MKKTHLFKNNIIALSFFQALKLSPAYTWEIFIRSNLMPPNYENRLEIEICKPGHYFGSKNRATFSLSPDLEIPIYNRLSYLLFLEVAQMNLIPLIWDGVYVLLTDLRQVNISTKGNKVKLGKGHPFFSYYESATEEPYKLEIDEEVYKILKRFAWI